MIFNIKYTLPDFENAVTPFIQSTKNFNRGDRFVYYMVTKHRGLSAISGAILIVLGYLHLFFPISDNMGITLILSLVVWVIGFMLLVLSFRVKRSLIRIWSQTLDYARPAEFMIDEENIAIKTDAASGTLTWNAIYKFAHDDRSILLYISPTVFYLIPRRVLSNEDWHNLINLGNSRVKNAW